MKNKTKQVSWARVFRTGRVACTKIKRWVCDSLKDLNRRSLWSESTWVKISLQRIRGPGYTGPFNKIKTFGLYIKILGDTEGF